ncbi:MAG: ethanolamine ammonia-lyase reactivating factor EutA [Gemmataceae bacterium]
MRGGMTNQVRLVGLDFGTTTSSAVVALASLQRTATGRMELEGIQEQFRSEMEFTPLLDDDSVDLQRVDGLLDQWLGNGHARLPDIFGGGALLTGLTAQKKNAAGLVRLIRERLGDSLVATAGDPCLESWLAFMGNCASLSKSRPDVPVLNLDIGGGTTNLALGKNGEVSRCGCLFVGARHIQVTPGTYRIVGLSSFAQCIFKKLGITRQVGDDLAPSERGAFLDCCIAVLEHVCGGNPTPKVQGLLPSLTQASFLMPPEVSAFAITFSGGVGELIYDHVRGKVWPGQTAYGDLGIDLARRILESPLLNRSTMDFQPQSGGRATVFGLLRYATEVSGSTLYLPITDILPLNDVPIFGSIDPSDSDERTSASSFQSVRKEAAFRCD